MRVEYSSHLYRVARHDSWNWIMRRKKEVATWGGVIFFVAAFFIWMVRGSEAEFLVPFFSGLIAVAIADAAVFAMHLLYLTPRKLCALKQQQLDSERHKFAATLEKEKQSMQLLVAELDTLKSRMDERPLKPLELREEIDQLIAEGEILLDSAETTMVEESELWFEDVERFAKRHLNPGQYDHLHAVVPSDVEEQVKFHRGVSESAPLAEEEFAVAERLVKMTSGLRELREEISRAAPRKHAVK
ncbi:hypothetical protein EV701_13527 [Chthoniobacter flavus]|nr:hypothetical protein EV701_13527 [Chthoniobacter flavus]